MAGTVKCKKCPDLAARAIVCSLGLEAYRLADSLSTVKRGDRGQPPAKASTRLRPIELNGRLLVHLLHDLDGRGLDPSELARCLDDLSLDFQVPVRKPIFVDRGVADVSPLNDRDLPVA